MLARKAQKAAKEVVAKQAANQPAQSQMTKDVVFPVDNKPPKMITTILKLVPEKSNINKWLTLGNTKPDLEPEDILIVEKEEKDKKWFKEIMLIRNAYEKIDFAENKALWFIAANRWRWDRFIS